MIEKSCKKSWDWTDRQLNVRYVQSNAHGKIILATARKLTDKLTIIIQEKELTSGSQKRQEQ